MKRVPEAGKSWSLGQRQDGPRIGKNQRVPESRKILVQNQGPVGSGVKAQMVPKLRGTNKSSTQGPVSLGERKKLNSESGTSRIQTIGICIIKCFTYV